jgi:hypothetical protein
MHAFGVLVQLGAAAAPTHVRYLRHLPTMQPFGLARQGCRLVQRDAGVQAQADQQRAFVERRQKAWSERTAPPPQRRPRHRHALPSHRAAVIEDPPRPLR